jgi:geranylgeranyl pyrophosphate synthase
MDDDDLRRGRPSSHVRFGEALAILVGDELLNLCYEILSTIPVRHSGETPGRALDCVATLSRASGSGGLITGQALDLAPPDDSLQTVERIHANKTARLIAASMELGAILAGAAGEARDAVRESGTLAGLAFQITDDLLDLEQDQESLGKTPGKDVENGKRTYPAVAGREESRARAAELTTRALSLLPQTPAASPLRELVAFLSSRRA